MKNNVENNPIRNIEVTKYYVHIFPSSNKINIILSI